MGGGGIHHLLDPSVLTPADKLCLDLKCSAHSLHVMKNITLRADEHIIELA